MFEHRKVRKALYDDKAMEQLISECYGDIYRYSYCILRNRENAQDITQETFLKFLSTSERYVEYGKLKNYLLVIAKNLIRDYWRKQKPVSLEGSEEIVAQSDQGLEGSTQRIDVLEAISTLTCDEQEMIVMRYYQELSIKDISVVMERPTSTVNYQIRKAEEKLRSILEE